MLAACFLYDFYACYAFYMPLFSLYALHYTLHIAEMYSIVILNFRDHGKPENLVNRLSEIFLQGI